MTICSKCTKTARQMTTKGSQPHCHRDSRQQQGEGERVTRSEQEEWGVMSCVGGFGSFEHYKNFYAANANEDAPLVGHDFLSLTIGPRQQQQQQQRQ